MQEGRKARKSKKKCGIREGKEETGETKSEQDQTEGLTERASREQEEPGSVEQGTTLDLDQNFEKSQL